ncbi:hypothetical protein [Marinoscillum sp.]|uniref:hypothetical protein n=1 Tax=Marinoscillum sp. TaxID=2024838 RepID=UPI003BAA7812
MSLGNDLQSKLSNLEDFASLTKSVLQYLPAVTTDYSDKSPYRIHIISQAGTTKYIRPINMSMFVTDVEKFENQFHLFTSILARIASGQRTFDLTELRTIDNTIYTIQQSIGAGLDLFVNPNSARKHVGNRFEELIKCVFTAIGIANKKAVLQIPYQTDQGEKIYKCENDLILSPFAKVKSSSKDLNEREVVVSIKTTSKDRMGKIFIDKMLLERFVNHPQKVIGIFLNDVQRKDENNISYTLVSGLFMVYTSFLTELEGIYYLDAPPNTNKQPYSDHMKKFSDLITQDIWDLLAP